MSIYRNDFDPLPRSDVHANKPTEKRSSVPPPTTSPKSAELEDRKYLRKAAPANMPVPHTLQWADGLPPSVRPAALLRQYARIANLIAVTWRDSEHFDVYMESLLTDKRGNRRGFPLEVLRELEALRHYRDTLDKDDDSAWSTVRKRG